MTTFKKLKKNVYETEHRGFTITLTKRTMDGLWMGQSIIEGYERSSRAYTRKSAAEVIRCLINESLKKEKKYAEKKTRTNLPVKNQRGRSESFERELGYKQFRYE